MTMPDCMTVGRVHGEELPSIPLCGGISYPGHGPIDSIGERRTLYKRLLAGGLAPARDRSPRPVLAP